MRNSPVDCCGTGMAKHIVCAYQGVRRGRGHSERRHLAGEIAWLFMRRYTRYLVGGFSPAQKVGCGDAEHLVSAMRVGVRAL